MRVLGLAGSPRARNSITLKLVEAGVAGAAEAGADGEQGKMGLRYRYWSEKGWI